MGQENAKTNRCPSCTVAYKRYKVFTVCFPSNHEPFSGFNDGVFARDLEYRRSRPLSLNLGGRLNGRCYFSVKKSNRREKKFQCVSSRLDASDLGPSLDLDANEH